MMSIIALESNTGTDRIQRSAGFIHGMSSYVGIYDPAGGGGGDQRFSDDKRAAAADVEDDEGDSRSSSSIGRDSDGDSSDDEVQSSIKGGALNNLNSLEEVLPIKRGISTFYSGKSKSFTSLADAASISSITDIVKPEDAYTRKRKNLLAHSLFVDKTHNSLPRSRSSGGIAKRIASSSKTTLSLGLTMTNSGSSNNNEPAISNLPSRSIALPPLPPHGRRLPNNEPSSSPPRRSPWRSFSLSDLQHATSTTPPVSGSVINNSDEEGKP